MARIKKLRKYCHVYTVSFVVSYVKYYHVPTIFFATLSNKPILFCRTRANVYAIEEKKRKEQEFIWSTYRCS
jgi:hypothetical protein